MTENQNPDLIKTKIVNLNQKRSKLKECFENTLGGGMAGYLMGSGIEDLFNLEPGSTFSFLETASQYIPCTADDISLFTGLALGATFLYTTLKDYKNGGNQNDRQ